jgi:hypothetical protein
VGALFTSQQVNNPVFPIMVRFWYNSEKAFNNSSVLSREKATKKGRMLHERKQSSIFFTWGDDAKR